MPCNSTLCIQDPPFLPQPSVNSFHILKRALASIGRRGSFHLCSGSFVYRETGRHSVKCRVFGFLFVFSLLLYYNILFLNLMENEGHLRCSFVSPPVRQTWHGVIKPQILEWKLGSSKKAYILLYKVYK